MAYLIDLFVWESGYPFGYILHEPANSAPTQSRLMQTVPEDEYDVMGEWFKERGLGPFDGEYRETSISDDLAMEIKMRWTNPEFVLDLTE